MLIACNILCSSVFCLVLIYQHLLLGCFLGFFQCCFSLRRLFGGSRVFVVSFGRLIQGASGSQGDADLQGTNFYHANLEGAA